MRKVYKFCWKIIWTSNNDKVIARLPKTIPSCFLTLNLPSFIATVKMKKTKVDFASRTVAIQQEKVIKSKFQKLTNTNRGEKGKQRMWKINYFFFFWYCTKLGPIIWLKKNYLIEKNYLKKIILVFSTWIRSYQASRFISYMKQIPF